MKVTGETFSFHYKRKRAEGARYQKYPNFQAKGPLPDRKSLGKPLQSLLSKELFPNYTGRIFQVKGQSKNSNITIFTLSFFI